MKGEEIGEWLVKGEEACESGGACESKKRQPRDKAPCERGEDSEAGKCV